MKRKGAALAGLRPAAISGKMGGAEFAKTCRRKQIGGRTFEDFDRLPEAEPDDAIDVSRGYILVDLENIGSD